MSYMKEYLYLLRPRVPGTVAHTPPYSTLAIRNTHKKRKISYNEPSRNMRAENRAKAGLLRVPPVVSKSFLPQKAGRRTSDGQPS